MPKQTPTSTNKPTHDVYSIQERDGKDTKNIWTRIGAAWAHNDGKGFNIQLNAMPFDGRLTLRDVKEAEDGDDS